MVWMAMLLATNLPIQLAREAGTAVLYTQWGQIWEKPGRGRRIFWYQFFPRLSVQDDGSHVILHRPGRAEGILTCRLWRTQLSRKPVTNFASLPPWENRAITLSCDQRRTVTLLRGFLTAFLYVNTRPWLRDKFIARHCGRAITKCDLAVQRPGIEGGHQWGQI